MKTFTPYKYFHQVYTDCAYIKYLFLDYTLIGIIIIMGIRLFLNAPIKKRVCAALYRRYYRFYWQSQNSRKGQVRAGAAD